ncbi:MAG TPA: hypothetical protein VNA15_06910 [Candidatus Angelobacter sp.]|nr:hypothetical protein [Candidatus Angelobacter sp.]
MQKSKEMLEKTRPHKVIRVIENSKVPLGEDESKLQRIKAKVEHDEPLSQEDEAVLTRLVEKAQKWEKGLEGSADTDPEDTMSG